MLILSQLEIKEQILHSITMTQNILVLLLMLSSKEQNSTLSSALEEIFVIH
jgi:hypothetical protein